jgi:hypothetical protein
MVRQLKKSKYIIGAISASLFIISGCGSAPVSNSSVAKQVSGTTANSSEPLGNEQSSVTGPGITTNGTTNVQNTQTNLLFQTTLTLPNGEVVTPDHSVRWKDLSIQLLITSLPPSYVSSERYAVVVGNHSEIISHETVSTSAGKATLVLNDRTPPAASQSTTSTYEYWVIVYGDEYAYAIDATIVGNRNNAKSEVMRLLRQWKVP